MNTFIKATVIALALSAGSISVQADTLGELAQSGQVQHPNGTAGK